MFIYCLGASYSWGDFKEVYEEIGCYLKKIQYTIQGV